jgi:hypothetical protein
MFRVARQQRPIAGYVRALPMCYYPGRMTVELYHGLFRWLRRPGGEAYVTRHEAGPRMIPCPTTGRPLRVATLDAETAAICPDCGSHSRGGFVSFVGDLRMAYACPECRQLVWLAGL